MAAAVLVVCLGSGVSWVPVGAQEEPSAPVEERRSDLTIAPPGSGNDVALADSTLRRAVRRLERGQEAGPGVEERGGRLQVEVLHDLDDAAASALVEGLGGTVDGRVPGVLVQAYVPADRLEELEAAEGVEFVRPPLPVSEPATDLRASETTAEASAGEQVRKTGAWIWHRAGKLGQGVRVGIVDYFGSNQWSSAQAAGEVPAPTSTFCRSGGSTCDIWATNHPHGEAVAEIVHEMAPSAQLYLATVLTASDLQAAVDWFATNNVRVVTRSLAGAYDGPGDGTGPMAEIIDDAVARGISWFQSAGNSAGSTTNPGGYWRGPWRDADSDGWLEFASGDEVLNFGCGYLHGLRWNDFAAGVNASDYDVYIYDTDPSLPGPPALLEGLSANRQGQGAPPLEHPGSSCSQGDTLDHMAVWRRATGNGTTNDVLEIMANEGIESGRWTNPYSASAPGTDTRSTGAMVVGAIDPVLGTNIAGYSSRGPTNDGRIKPDISAASGVTSHSYGRFSGTSASTPVVAGAAALVRGAGYASTPTGVRNWLLTNATVDRGAAGTDNTFGRGEMILPAFQPDNHIRHSSDTTFVGDDTYSDTAPGQSRTATVRRGAGATFYIRVQNDGTRKDSFRMAGTPTTAGYTVQYLSGSTDITAAVVAGTYHTARLEAGSSATITMRLTLSTAVTTGRNFLVTSISDTDSGRRDRVSAVITPFT